jgi:hypothetical protein
MKTTIIILGTIHIDKESSPAYSGRLEKLLEEIKPDVLYAELSAEQLDGSTAIETKPEYTDVILPFVKKIDIPVIPIQPHADAGKQMEEEKEAILDRIEQHQWLRVVWDFSSQWEECMYAKLIPLLDDPEAIEKLQLTEIDKLHIEPWFEVLGRYFPEYITLWDKWNEHFLEKIQQAIKEHEGKRILVTVGLNHKYWLMDKLTGSDNTDVFDLQTFRKSV